MINDRPLILDRWKRDLARTSFSTYHATTPLDMIARITSKHYDLILIDLGESSLDKRPYALAHMIRDIKPNSTLVGVSGCNVIEEQEEPFDKIIIDGPNISYRLREILLQTGFKNI